MKKFFLSIYFIISQFVGILCLYFWRKIDVSTTLPDQLLVIAIAVGIVSSIIMWVHNKFIYKFKYSEFSIISTLFFILNLIFYLNFGLQTFTNVDRSRSFYIFQWIDCSQDKLTKTQIRNLIFKTYGNDELKSFDKRLVEQKKRNLLKENQNKIFLTSGSKFLLNSSNYLASNFNLNGWYSHPLVPGCSKYIR